jgi:hypothetical protein
MHTPWTITEFDLTKLVFRRRTSFRETAIVVAVTIVLGVAGVIIHAHWNDLFGSAGPWLLGLVILVVAAVVAIGMIEQAKDRRGLQAAADISDRSSLDDILADQLDRIGPVAGVSARDVLKATSTMLSGPSSEQATPPEHRPDRRIVAGLLQIILWTMIAIVALVAVGFAIYFALPTTPPLRHPTTMFKLIVAGPAAIIAFLLFLLARTRKKSADHLLEYDQRPPIVFLRSFKDDQRKIWMVRQNDSPVRVGFEDALSEIFFRVGPFIALGSKKDLIPRLGAARTYRDDTVWQAKAKGWMKNATWILYLLGSTKSLKWEIGQITLDQLVEKTIFLFPPNVGARDSRLQRHRLQSWSLFLEAFANTEFHDALKGFDQSNAIAMWIGPDRHIFVVRASGEYFQEYDLALRIVLYLKNRAGIPSLVMSGEPSSAGSMASGADLALSRRPEGASA